MTRAYVCMKILEYPPPLPWDVNTRLIAGMHNSLFWLSISPAGRGQLVKMLITL